MQALARKLAPKAFDTLGSIAEHSKSDAARVAAATAILDRAFGKPKQAVEHTGEDGGPVEVFVTHEIIDASAPS
jgi:hypothetical protein